MTSTPFSTAVPTAALSLGVAGLIPFLGLSLAEVAGLEPFGRAPMLVLAQYAATTLSFMGAVHWGLAMGEYGGRRDASWSYAASVVPGLVAWFALAFFPLPVALRIMAFAYAALLVYDLGAVRRGFAPAWYGRLRWPLTGVVVPCLFFASMLS
jgi:hypothetical protein